MYVPVSVLPHAPDENNLINFSCVVLVDYSLAHSVSIGDFCHSRGICFIIADVFGIMGGIFCDFGDSFSFTDNNGEPPSSAMIANISNENPALVTVEESTQHNLETGNTVVLSEVLGMPDINGRELQITVRDSYTFSVNLHTSSMPTYRTGGYMNQIKKPERLSFQPLSACIQNPGEIRSDVTKTHHNNALHLLYRALHEFKALHSRLPIPGDIREAEKVYDIACTLNTEYPLVTRWDRYE